MREAATAYEQGKWSEAEQLCRLVLKAAPDYFYALSLLGIILARTRRMHEAIELLSRATAVNPGDPDAHNNRGNVLRELGRYEAALESYDRAISLRPDFAEAHNNRGITLANLRRHEAALKSFERALQAKPDYEFLYGRWLLAKMQVCDWDGIEGHFARLTERIARGDKASEPGAVLSMPVSPLLQKKAAQTWVRAKYPGSDALPPMARRPAHEKLRIGYVSADFREHSVSRQMVELLERHDRRRFESIAISLSPEEISPTGQRVKSAFDRFVDVSQQSDAEAARIMRGLDVDIAVDLMGYTKRGRPGIFAARGAPVQVAYLGYLGTTGAPYIDYLIADATIIPQECRQHYSERIVYLPSYQVNDSKRHISDRVFTRAELGLPPRGFVFCCFCDNYKISPDVFDGWMRILKRVDGSALLLYADSELAAQNLQKEARLRGCDANRIVIAKRLPVEDYLARFRVPDLFLNTLPYNAGTIASDALWAGLPVLTRAGETFAGRVTASLLEAVRLPELIAAGQEQYESLAVELATHPQRLQAIRQKLDANRLTAPLFDIEQFTTHIEAAYREMHERYGAGQPAADIVVREQLRHSRD